MRYHRPWSRLDRRLVITVRRHSLRHRLDRGSGSAGQGVSVRTRSSTRPNKNPPWVTGELDQGCPELASECHRSAVGELPFRRGPDRDHDARWRSPQRLDVAPVAHGRPDQVSEDSSVSARIRAIAAATVPSAVPGLPCRRGRKRMGRAGRYRRSPVSPGGLGGSVCSPGTAARRRSSSWPPSCPPAPGPPARHPRQGHTRLAARLCRDRARLCRLHGTLARCRWRDRHLRFRL